jgi:hypothetical protein
MRPLASHATSTTCVAIGTRYEEGVARPDQATIVSAP